MVEGVDNSVATPFTFDIIFQDTILPQGGRMNRVAFDKHLEEVRANIDRMREENERRVARLSLRREPYQFSTVPKTKPPSSIPPRRPLR
jgi:hypothetical protein